MDWRLRSSAASTFDLRRSRPSGVPVAESAGGGREAERDVEATGPADRGSLCDGSGGR
jgi:hypothetical protein